MGIVYKKATDALDANLRIYTPRGVLKVGTLVHIILKSLPFMASTLKTDALSENMPTLGMLFSIGGTKM